MNNRISPEITALETARFFMIMGNLSAAKAEGKAEALAEWVDELDAMAMWSALPFLAKRANIEAASARDLLTSLQSDRLGCVAGSLVVATSANAPANLN